MAAAPIARPWSTSNLAAMLELLTNPQTWIAFATLTALELVLGIDSIIFISFLVVVGVVLVAEGFDQHVPKGCVYFAMAFSLVVEMINIRLRRKSAKKVQLHPPHIPGD
jgi:predicted tellurium resistance membrane protein TerC